MSYLLALPPHIRALVVLGGIAVGVLFWPLVGLLVSVFGGAQ